MEWVIREMLEKCAAVELSTEVRVMEHIHFFFCWMSSLVNLHVDGNSLVEVNISAKCVLSWVECMAIRYDWLGLSWRHAPIGCDYEPLVAQ